MVAQVEFADNESIAIPLTDDGLVSPDVIAGDFLFSGSFYALTSTGWYSPLLSTALPSNLTDTSLKPTRMVAGEAFYVQKPLSEPPPPSRLKCLQTSPHALCLGWQTFEWWLLQTLEISLFNLDSQSHGCGPNKVMPNVLCDLTSINSRDSALLLLLWEKQGQPEPLRCHQRGQR